MLDQKYFWVLAVLLMSGCCPCHQMQIGDKYCLLIQDLNRYLNTGCTVKVIDVSKNLQGEEENIISLKDYQNNILKNGSFFQILINCPGVVQSSWSRSSPYKERTFV